MTKKITIADLIEYLERFDKKEQVFLYCDALSEYLPFEKYCFGSIAVKSELKVVEKKGIVSKHLERTNKSRRHFKQFLIRRGYK